MPETRNALSDRMLDELLAAFTAARDDEARALRRAHVDARDGVLERRRSRGLRRRRAARAQAPRDGALPTALPPDRRAGQAHDLRRERSRAGRCARARAGLRPDRREGLRHVRHPRDPGRPLPVHDHGSALSQRRSQEGERAPAPRRAHRRGRGHAHRPRQQGRACRRVRLRRSTSGRRSWPPGRRS